MPFVVIMPIASVILIIKFMRVNSIGREAFIMRTRILMLVQERSITGICDGSGNPACNLAHGVLLRFDRRRERGRNNIAFFSFIAKGAGVGGGGEGRGKGGHEKSNHLHELVSAAAARHTERHSYEIHYHSDFTCVNKKKSFIFTSLEGGLSEGARGK